MPQTLLTIPEACSALRVSRQHLHRLVQRREIGSIKTGTRRLIPAVAIERFIEEHAA